MIETIIYIESNTSGTGEIFIRKAIKYGMKPILLTANPSIYSFLHKIPGLIIHELNTQSFSEIVKFCEKFISDGNSIKGVFSSSEYYIEIVGRVASYFSLPSVDSIAILNCRNKYLQYKILNENSLHLPKTKIVQNLEELNIELVDMEYPIIVKPIAGTGSVGVRLCNDYNECCELVKQLISYETNERGIKVDNRILLEEYIRGEEYSGEVFDGKLIGITKKHLGSLPYFIEIGHDFPEEFEATKYDQVKDEILKAVNALKLNWGACHVEFRIMNGEIYIIEVNPRLAGGFIPEIVKQSLGIDLIDNQLRKALDLPIILEKSKNGKIAIRFVIPSQEGYLISFANQIEVDGILEVREYKSIGSKYEKKGDFRDRVGHIIFDMNIISSRDIDVILNHLKVLEDEIQ